MSDITHRLELTDEEVLLLDGKCRESVQHEVELAKSRTAMREKTDNAAIAAFVVKVAAVATKDKKLIQKSVGLTYCGVCKKSAGYHEYKRTSRYHRKGEPNYKMPKRLSGVDLKCSTIRVDGHASVGCCLSCFCEATPHLVAALEGVDCELPESLRSEGYQPVKRVGVRECTKCGWSGPETEMGQEMTLMGDGYFPASCPKCSAKNSLFVTNVKHTGEYVLQAVVA